jgi:uncharacterized repeat protein (TIGR01451 family)/CSLREA domain-containing protein
MAPLSAVGWLGLESLVEMISAGDWPKARLVSLVLLMGLVLLVAPAAARAGTLVVNRTDDLAGASCAAGSCTLRAAIVAADSDGGNDTILIPAGTYQLTSAGGGPISITASMTLTGAGPGAASTTIVAAPLSQIFKVSGGDVTLDELTLTGVSASDQGGAIEATASASLTVARDDIANNVVTNNFDGGGIYDQSSGPPLIEASTLSGNTGYNGGALNSGAPTRIVNSTFTANHAGDPTHNGDGGAMQVDNAVLVNDTISGNECFNGSGCGGGFIGSLSAADTIIAGNTDNSAAVDNCAGTVTITGPDLENGTDCKFTTDGSKQGNPLLGPLADNGGPTPTMLPGPGSPAIDGGTDATCAAQDQRGGARPAPGGGPCDIGAVEVDSLADLTIVGKVSPAAVVLGGGVAYTLTAINQGPDPALEASLENLLPAGATFVGANTSVGSCSGSTTLTCALGTLAPDASVTVNVSASLGLAGVATDIASAHAPATDLTPEDNQVSLLTNVLAPVLLNQASTATATVTRPVLSMVSVSPARFRVGRASTAISAKTRTPRGTTIGFTLNVPARVSILLQRKLSGRRSGRRCLAPTGGRQHGPHCTRLVAAGTLTRTGTAGANHVAFSGRVGSHALAAGSYLATLTATGSGAPSSAPASVAFTVLSSGR